ncbi:hypothetical protein K2173_015887 [Erythroxylum novogranatense]|uniref:Senescence domain-containing protein n=1 Tax=Erythroxylum novogranatense TaxID=1862640 RepID=A0AAV8SFC0_9ROSI|nr:hypothetical protein K2173_015887 [Erythroxylum novogranatense]
MEAQILCRHPLFFFPYSCPSTAISQGLLSSRDRAAGVAEMGFSKHSNSQLTVSSKQKNLVAKTPNHKVTLRIPGCTVHLMDQGEVLELAKGEFLLIHVLDKGVPVATIVKVGDDLSWPLTKDEPVVKLDSLHYLFSLPIKNSNPLSFGVTFSEQCTTSLPSLDSFLSEHSCFSASTTGSRKVDWKQFAPRMEDYNNILAKAIAGGTGQIVKGIFIISNAYSNKIHSGGEMILARVPAEKPSDKSEGATKKTGINKTLERVKNLSRTTENVSKAMLDGIGGATESLMAPVVKSQAAQNFLSTATGEVLLASLDAVNKIMEAAEVAEKQALSATSSATTSMVTERFGETAGAATGDMLATTGHCVNTAWNVLKIRKVVNPASTVSRGIAKNARKTNT